MDGELTRYVLHNGENLWDFEVLPGVKFLNANHIHPLKQRDLTYLCREFGKDPNILEVIVFGSAVRFDCHSRSDLDILVVRLDNAMRLEVSLDGIQSEMDVIFASHMGERLKNEIGRTGVLVYRR